MFLIKKYIKKNNKNAFTMIELSIVILVISVMVVGVATGKSLITKSRLANAKSLTRQSVINDMGDDLIAWYETSLEGSFKESETKNDGSFITLWKDSNKNAVNKNDAFAVTPLNISNQPSLYQNVFYNSIPGLRFSGAQYLNFNGTKFAKNSYTVFVVEQRRSGKNSNYFISGLNPSISSRLALGYSNSTSIMQSHYGTGNDFSKSIFLSYSPSSLIPRIHTFLFNNSIGKSYTLNGINQHGANQMTPLTSFNLATIGYHLSTSSSSYYEGDLAEIIMFKRSLKTEEVEAIESYLGSKYGIPVS
jgi:prepilin-type N-terminal cleavage/methylation domain-containing protein